MDNTGPQVFPGNANPALAKEIADYVGIELGQATVTSFPNGETFVKINENIRGRDIYIVQPSAPPTNQNLMELLIMIDAARRASARRITAVMPFYGYARQDRNDQPRVPITAKLVANLLVASGATRVLCMDLHAQQIQGFFDIPVDHLYAAPVLYRYLASLKLHNLVVVSPDALLHHVAPVHDVPPPPARLRQHQRRRRRPQPLGHRAQHLVRQHVEVAARRQPVTK